MEPASELVPERPASVPDKAEWIADQGIWELAATALDGTKHGEARQWRGDGVLYMRAHYAKNVLDGPFALFHPNGEIAREGNYVAGELDGLVTSFASDATTPETLRACCVPDGAWQMKANWD